MTAHPTREEDFELYALGALEGEEQLAIQSHLAVCAACTRKLEEAQGRIAMLAFSAPPVEPSPVVKERLMRQIRSSGAAPGRETARPEPAPKFFGGWWTAVLAPAALALALLSIFLWNQNARLDRQLADLRASMAAQQKELADARAYSEILEAKDTITVPLALQPGAPQGGGKMMYNAKMGMLLCDGWIEPAPANKSYQVWVVPMHGAPISAGVFNSADAKANRWMMKVQPGIAAKAFAVSLEPKGGMPQPTGPMVLVGSVS